jgi:hypothetical protein
MGYTLRVIHQRRVFMKILFVAAVLALVAIPYGEANQNRRGMAPRAQTYEAPRASMNAGGHRMAGCGLGSMVVEDSSKWAQVGAAILNGTGVQTFGITFGTSNCTESGVAHLSKEKNLYVEANLPELKRDVAVGKGEYLAGLSALYGCGSGELEALVQKESSLFDGAPESVVPSLDEAVARAGLSCQG